MAVWAVFGTALLLCARPALGQTVNLWGQNWTGDVSSLLSTKNSPLVSLSSVQERYRRYRPAYSCLRGLLETPNEQKAVGHRERTTEMLEGQARAAFSTQTRRPCHGPQEHPSESPWTSLSSMDRKLAACA